jgi:hypothetical protein
VFAITLLIVVPVMNFILPTRIGPFKGGYYTIATLPWFLHNALFCLVRYTVAAVRDPGLVPGWWWLLEAFRAQFVSVFATREMQMDLLPNGRPGVPTRLEACSFRLQGKCA